MSDSVIFSKPLTVGAICDVDTLKGSSNISTLDCDLIEVRLDYPGLFPNFNMEDRLNLPLLLTCRCEEEGGQQALSPDETNHILSSHLHRASAIDLEIRSLQTQRNLIQKSAEQNIPLIASSHDFQKTPSLKELKALYFKAQDSGASVAKFAFHLNQFEDIQTGLKLLALRESIPIAVMGMGPLAAASRLLYAQAGSALNYGYLGEQATAPGQWRARTLKDAISQSPAINPQNYLGSS